MKDPAESSADRRIAAVEPYIRDVRRQLFGVAEPPFKSLKAAERWENTLTRLAVTGKETSTQRAYREAIEAATHGTGFTESDVRAWITVGARPTFHPIRTRIVNDKGISLADGTRITRKSATITLHALPTELEFRKLYRKIKRMWGDPSEGPDFSAIMDPDAPQRESKQSDLSVLERHIEAIYNRGGNWEERLELWKATVPEGWSAGAWKARQGDATVNALRVRYSRMTTKKEELEKTRRKEE